MILDQEKVTDRFRDLVLEALDKAAHEFGMNDGWKDGDLPRLFRAVDRQIEELAVRYEIALVDKGIET